MNQKNLSFDYVDINTKYYKYLSNQQYTIPQDENGLYDGVLNDKGQNLYLYIKNMVERNDFKGKITNSIFVSELSGLDNSENFIILNSWNNKRLRGKLNGKEQQTSIILFFEYTTPKNGWIYTISGSLYEFELTE